MSSLVLRNLTFRNAPMHLIAVSLVAFIPLTTYRNGFDWPSYEEWVNEIILRNSSYSDFLSYSSSQYIDTGFSHLIYASSFISEEFVFFQFLIGVITLILYFLITKKFELNFYIFIAIFFCTIWLRLETSTLRQAIVLPLFWIALYYFYNRGFVKGATVLIIGTLIHKSALILLPTIFLIFVPVSWFVHFLIIVVGIVVQATYSFLLPVYDELLVSLLNFATNDFIAYKLSSYLDTFSQPFTVQKLFIILSVLYFHIFKVEHKYYNLLMKILIGQFIINFYFPFIPNVVILRLEYYFIISWVALLSIQVSQKVENLSKNKFYYIIIIMTVLNLKLALFFKDEATRLVYFPYYSVFHYAFGQALRGQDSVDTAIAIHEDRYDK